MNPAEVESYVRMARAYAAEQLPFFAPGLFAARLVMTEACPSLAAVDKGLRVYFHPTLTAELLASEADLRDALQQLAWVWVHEISHVLREHADRATDINAEPFRWNVAADLEINDGDWEGLFPPRSFPPLFAKQFHLPNGHLAEFYYQHIRVLKEKILLCGLPGANKLRDEGSGVHGIPCPWELSDDADKVPAVPDLEQDRLREQLAKDLIHSKSRGTIPAGWQRWAETICKGKVNWRDLLKRRLRGAITIGTGRRTDYTLQRPNRRAATYQPFIRPALRSNLDPHVACVVDTSGSMGPRELSQALAEVRSVLEALRVPITVIPCDAVAYDPIRIFTNSDYLKLETGLRGGGGTDMCKGLDAATKLKPSPDAIIVLTDGFTPYPPRPLRTPVLFGILIGRYYFSQVYKPPIPPWREEDVITIRLDELEDARTTGG